MKKIAVFLLSISMLFLCVSVVSAQPAPEPLWTAMPPYNLLWPLWSPILSPPDPKTGAPTPILKELTSTTILPIQPVIVYDPRNPLNWLDVPYYIYNIGSETYWTQDWRFSLYPFPPQQPDYYPPELQVSYPLQLQPGYEFLPYDPSWIIDAYPFVNSRYLNALYALYYINPSLWPSLWIGSNVYFPPYNVYLP